MKLIINQENNNQLITDKKLTRLKYYRQHLCTIENGIFVLEKQSTTKIMTKQVLHHKYPRQKKNPKLHQFLNGYNKIPRHSQSITVLKQI